MTLLATHSLGASVIAGVMLTATLAFSGYHQEGNYTKEPSFISTVELKQDLSNLKLAVSDKKQIADAVMKQLAAFRNKDAKTAYELAAPLAQSEFSSPEHFLNELGDMYDWFSMAKMKDMDGIDMSEALPRQRILLTSPTGRQWLAYFTVEKQQGGAWKILGFMVEEASGHSV